MINIIFLKDIDHVHKIASGIQCGPAFGRFHQKELKSFNSIHLLIPECSIILNRKGKMEKCANRMELLQYTKAQNC